MANPSNWATTTSSFKRASEILTPRSAYDLSGFAQTRREFRTFFFWEGGMKEDVIGADRPEERLES